MIYFLKTKDGLFVKIGYTKYRDQMRIDQISASSPTECELVLFIEGDLYDEKSLHKQFEECRVAGKNEWFNFSTNISRYVNENKHLSEMPVKRLEGVRKGNKTSPFGCRFDIEKLDFIQKRERLESYQKVVDFLLNKYWWEHKVATVTAKEAPPLSLKNDKVFDEPPELPKPQIALKRTPAHWVELRRECGDADEYAKWLEDLENDPYLTSREKRDIKATV